VRNEVNTQMKSCLCSAWCLETYRPRQQLESPIQLIGHNCWRSKTWLYREKPLVMVATVCGKSPLLSHCLGFN